MRTRRMLFALGLALVSLGLVAPPASAGENLVVLNDPADATGAGDILAFRMYVANDQLVLQLRTKKPLDLDTAPAWNTDQSASQIKFSIDGGGDPRLEHAVIISADGSGPNLLSLTYLHPSPRGPGCGTLAQPENTIIRVRINLTCLSQADVARVSVRYKLDQGGDGTINSNDRAPDVGFSPTLNIVN